jgi:acetyl esterase
MSIRVADVHLRGRTGTLRGRVHQPSTPDRALLVLLDGNVDEVDPLCRELCTRAGLVVLAAPVTGLDDATAVVEWAADHAAELGADPHRLLLAGVGAATALAAEVARQATATGWPVLRLLDEPPTSPERTRP